LTLLRPHEARRPVFGVNQLRAGSGSIAAGPRFSHTLTILCPEVQLMSPRHLSSSPLLLELRRHVRHAERPQRATVRRRWNRGRRVGLASAAAAAVVIQSRPPAWPSPKNRGVTWRRGHSPMVTSSVTVPPNLRRRERLDRALARRGGPHRPTSVTCGFRPFRRAEPGPRLGHGGLGPVPSPPGEYRRRPAVTSSGAEIAAWRRKRSHHQRVDPAPTDVGSPVEVGLVGAG